MIVTTTPSIEGQKITAYHGVVVGEAILGANVFRDVFAGITDIIGGRAARLNWLPPVKVIKSLRIEVLLKGSVE